MDSCRFKVEKLLNIRTLNVRFFVLPGIMLLIALAGCQQKESPQQLREQTAKATAEAKSDAKAVADGIREGWNRNQPLDVNAASKDQLMSLPGMTAAEADRVIAGRPYGEPDELVTRHIVAKAEYDKIADRVTAKK
jgi:competence protein ComEA